ncbi:MAG TPA: tryptophan halogenase family protein [Steroidobacteraceae bacterium]|jgi:tryptophan halogenase|nr:tryptophan halogenase family protein [Steroidobacteraceae bacterium]
MQQRFKKILIVGGGTAGWMTAAAFGRMLKNGGYQFELIESDEIGTVGVGEATIPPIVDYNRTMGIDEVEFMRATQASFKLAIEFVDWTRLGHSYIHPFGHYGVPMENVYFHNFWLRHRAQGGTMSHDLFNSSTMAARAGRFSRPMHTDRSPLPPLGYAYHFDAGLYAAYLRKLAEADGVRRIEGKVIDVKLRGEDGYIESVKLADGRVVEADFFIDCSGFRGLLIEQALHGSYEDWREWLPCDRALAVPCERVPATTPYTRSTAREAGWQWRIPLQHRTGNGYVYCSEFISDDEATSLLLGRLDGAARATPRPLRFVAGRRKECWKKNCVAIGLSSGFLEPLESTSIHLIQTAIAKLLFMLPRDHIDQSVIDKYNDMLKVELEEIRDFLVLHYTATERNDTPFWRHCQAIKKPDSLVQKWEMYERSAVIVAPPGELFRESSWFAVFTGQNVIPKTWHPSADIPSNEELERRLQIIAGDVRKRVDGFPTHDEYIRMHCAAQPMPAKPMTQKAM